MTAYELVIDDGDTYYTLGLYANHSDAEADKADLEERYPGRPYCWTDFDIHERTIVSGRQSAEALADGCIAIADRSTIDAHWGNPRAKDSWLSEHGEPR